MSKGSKFLLRLFAFLGVCFIAVIVLIATGVIKPPAFLKLNENNNSQKSSENGYVDYDSLTYNTYKNSNNVDIIELADALKISNACYNNISIELKNYNNSVEEKKRYDFDTSKFAGTMFTGEQIRESSLIEYVQEGESITSASDYNDRCRGPFKIGAAAMEEANDLAVKFTGEKVLRTEADLYDQVRATRACIYIAIKNYEYCSGIIGDAVTPNMVFDSYLYGCGTVRGWLKECLDKGEYNGSYSPKNYSKDIMYYHTVLDEYWKNFTSGLTNGEHDSYWKDTYYNKLWKKPDWDSVE